ncbi:DUF4423 domain-containing protein [bacterium]|nr:MAG: DUF4423 domain-containing protein [bacterium]
MGSRPHRSQRSGAPPHSAQHPRGGSRRPDRSRAVAPKSRLLPPRWRPPGPKDRRFAPRKRRRTTSPAPLSSTGIASERLLRGPLGSSRPVRCLPAPCCVASFYVPRPRRRSITSIPTLQTPKAIAEHLGVSLDRIQYYLAFLTQYGLVDLNEGRYKMTKKFVHLEPGSPLVAKHHANWRMRVLQSLEQGCDNDLHYSSVFTVSSKDIQSIKELLREALREANKKMSDSAEEELYGMSLDVFKI